MDERKMTEGKYAPTEAQKEMWHRLGQIGKFLQGRSYEEVEPLLRDTLEATIQLHKDEGKVSKEDVVLLEQHVENVLADMRNGKPLYPILGIKEESIEEIYAEGYRLYEGGFFEQALEFFDVATFFDFRDPRFALAVAACHQRLKHYDEALRDYKWLAYIEPEVPLPFFYAYECCVQLHDNEGARLALEELVRRASASPIYKEQLDRATIMLQGHLAKYGGGAEVSQK